MKSKIALVSLFLLLSVSLPISAQFYAGISIGAKDCLSENLDPTLIVVNNYENKTWGKWNEKIGLIAGYRFKNLPFTLETGAVFSKFSHVIYFTESVLDFGGIKNFKKITPTFSTLEIPLTCRFRVIELSGNIVFHARLGISTGRIGSDVVNSGEEGVITKYSSLDHENYHFDYHVLYDSHQEWGLSLFGGIETTYRLGKNFDIGLSFSASHGLTHGTNYIFIYEVRRGENPYEYGDAINTSKWDNLSIDLTGRYYFSY